MFNTASIQHTEEQMCIQTMTSDQEIRDVTKQIIIIKAESSNMIDEKVWQGLL